MCGVKDISEFLELNAVFFEIVKGREKKVMREMERGEGKLNYY